MAKEGSVVWTLIAFIFIATVAVVHSYDAVDIIAGYGYPVEVHTATTTDQYNLVMFRIPYGLRNTGARRGVVFFQHGVTDNANGAILNAPTESLPFILADNGWDVWMGNNRGNGYSMSNNKYSTNSADFWNFSWDQMAQYDLPTQLSYVLQKTNKTQLTYIGHSQGTVQAFAGFENPATSRMVNLFIALAPIAYVYHERAKIGRILADLDTGPILELLGDREFYLPNILHKLLPDACVIDPAACNFLLEFIAGPSNNLNVSRFVYFAKYEPNPTSVIDMIHWSQGVKENKFQKFDYGTSGNMQHYNQPTPPQYDLGKVTLPVALFTGSNDYLADPQDVARLKSELGKPPVFELNEPSYGHCDFIMADDAYKLIYPSVLSLVAQYNK